VLRNFAPKQHAHVIALGLVLGRGDNEVTLGESKEFSARARQLREFGLELGGRIPL
jgi:hypothetical protein